MVVHVSLTTVTTNGLILVPCSYVIKITLVTYEKSVVQLDSTKHGKFFPGTPVSSCSNTGLKRIVPYWTSGRTAQVADRVIQYK